MTCIVRSLMAKIHWLLFLLSGFIGLFGILGFENNNGGTESMEQGETSLDTRARWEWPVAIRLSISNGDVYFCVQEVLEVLHLKNEVKRHGFTRIENFLNSEGTVR